MTICGAGERCQAPDHSRDLEEQAILTMGEPKPQPRRYQRDAEILNRKSSLLNRDTTMMTRSEVAAALDAASRILKDRKLMNELRNAEYILDIVFDIYCSVSFLCEEEGAFVRKRELA